MLLADGSAYDKLEGPPASASEAAPLASPVTRFRRRRLVACVCAVPILLFLVIVPLYVWVSQIPGRLPAESSGSFDMTGDELFVLTVADWGGVPFYPYVTPAQLGVRDQMSKAVNASSAARKLILALGDNFYFAGVTSVDDPRFKATFEEVYVEGYPELSGKDMWRLVAGNHDYMATRDVSPQIAYSNRSRTWHFPAHYYTFTEDVGTDPASGKHRVAQFVMIDTVLLSVGVDGILSSEEQGRSEAHWAWLASTLAASTADYLVVAGHYPVWSVCSHGPTPLLVQRLRPLLAASKASAYFYGHDHCAQAFVDGGVHHHGVGGAHLLDYGTPNLKAVPEGSLRFSYGALLWPTNVFKGAFATASFGLRAMTVTHYDSDGRAIHTLRQLPRVR